MAARARRGLSLFKEWLIEQSRSIAVPLLVLGLVGLSIGINMYRYTRGFFLLYPVFAGNILLVAKCFVCIAEVCFGLLLLPVSRGFVTWLRSTWLRHIIDFDAALNFHAWLAVIGLVAGTVHGICATIAYSNVGKIPFEIQAAVGRDPKDVAGMLLSWNVLSGWGLFALACITFPFALKWPRQAPWMKDTKLGKVLNNPDLFWVTHHILIVVFIPVAVLHSIKWTPGFPQTWHPAFLMSTTKFFYYIAVPVIIYLFNRLQRIATASHLALVVDAGVVGGDVLALKVLKPRFFNHKPGQYLFMCCPRISPYEWHPFTITSSPQDNFISVHIKKAGDWTAALHGLFKPATSTNGSASSGPGHANVTAPISVGGGEQVKQQLLAPSAHDSSAAPATARGVNLVQHIDHADESHTSLPALTTSASRTYRRVSVDIIERLEAEAALHVPVAARTRRISAPGFGNGGFVSREGSAVGISTEKPSGSALGRAARRVSGVLSGAYDPRAERVTLEAEERLKQAATEVTAGRHGSAPGAHEPAFAAFTGFINRAPSNDNTASGTAAAVGVAAGPGVGQLMSAGSGGGTLKGVKEDEDGEVFVPPLLYIDGPFGAPTQDFEHYKVVVLIGTGIGITPMASVLRSLMHDLYDARCDTCGTLNRRLCRIIQRKVYVHWVTRNLEGMAWFEELLASISALDVDNVFQFNVHITRANKPAAKPVSGNQIMPADAAAAAVLRIASADPGAAKNCGCNAPGGTGGKGKHAPVNYSYSRPDMAKHLGEVQGAHAGEFVGVFFCGPRVMGQQVHRSCRHLNAAANEAANAAAIDPECPACARPSRLYFHEEIF